MGLPKAITELGNEVVAMVKERAAEFPRNIHTIKRQYTVDVNVSSLTEARMYLVPRLAQSSGGDSGRDAIEQNIGFTFILQAVMRRPVVEEVEEVDELVDTIDAIIQIFEEQNVALPIAGGAAYQFGAVFDPLFDEDLLKTKRVFHSEFNVTFIWDRTLG